MPVQRTLSIIKPDGVAQNVIGTCLAMLEGEGLKIQALVMFQPGAFPAAKWATFYEAHKGRPFFPKLIEFMASGPVVVSVLEGEDAVEVNRRVMGATDPKQRAEGTIRWLFSDDIMLNVVHGSDTEEAARRKIAFFFPKAEER